MLAAAANMVFTDLCYDSLMQFDTMKTITICWFESFAILSSGKDVIYAIDTLNRGSEVVGAINLV